MSRTRVNFQLPEELVQKADVATEVSKKNRTEIIKEALQKYFAEVEEALIKRDVLKQDEAVDLEVYCGFLRPVNHCATVRG